MRKNIIYALCAAALLLSACGGSEYSNVKTENPNQKNIVTTDRKKVIATDVSVTVDGIPIEALDIGGETVIALEDLTKCDFKENHHFGDETFDMIAGHNYKYEGNTVEPREKGTILGDTTPSSDIVRVNGIKIYSDVFNEKHYASVQTLGELTDPYNEEWGYSDYNMRLISNGNEETLECFRFPPVEYNTRLEKTEQLVDLTEADIYTETDISEITHFGSPNEPQTGIYAGIVGDGNGGANENDTPTFSHGFGVYSSYIEFDEKQTELYYPNKRIVRENDCVMLIPWNIEDITHVFDEDYQEYIHQTLDTLKGYDKPVIVRFGAEMNIGYLGSSPSAYVKAFRHMADIIHDYGFAVMWAPNDMSELGKDFAFYYPGDKYVDWIGVSCFMRMDYLTQAPTTHGDAVLFNFGDYAYHTNSVKYITSFMEENNISKPLAVSEGGVISLADYDGAPANFNEWAHERLGNMYWYLPMRYPQIKMITYFNHTSKGAPIGYWLKDKPDYIPIIEDALQDGPYLLSGSDEADFTFVRADGRDYKKEEIPIYTYLYVPGKGGHTVEYVLDGEVIGKHTQIPYKMTLSKSSLKRGSHTLSVWADGQKVKEYTVTNKKDIVSIRIKK